MTGERTRVLGPRGHLAALTLCALVAVAGASPAAAGRAHTRPQGLWRAYPLEQSPPTSAAGKSRPTRSAARRSPQPTRTARQQSRRLPPAEPYDDSALRPITVVGAVVVGVLVAGGGLALLWLRRRGPAPALRAPLPAPRARHTSPPPEPALHGHGRPAAETCWIVCWRADGWVVFSAIARDLEGRQQCLGESLPFAATSNEPLILDGAAFEAVQSLAARLSQDGWEAVPPVGGRGEMWHAQEFRRKDVAAATAPAARPGRSHGRHHASA